MKKNIILFLALFATIAVIKPQAQQPKSNYYVSVFGGDSIIREEKYGWGMNLWESRSLSAKYHFTLKDLPPDSRPRERLARLGAENLSTAELLAIILRTGSRGRTALEGPTQDLLTNESVKAAYLGLLE